MKIVVFGCGKVGKTIISSLSGEGHDITAIDRDPAVIEEITNIYDVIGLCGNGVDCDTMTEAGVNDCELFISVTGTDELNMLSCFIAKSLGASNTLARIRNPEYNDFDLGFLKQQLNLSVTLNPELAVAHEISDILRFPSAAKVETFSNRNLKIVDFHLKEDSPFVELSLSEIRRKYQAKFLVCYVTRGEEVYIPDGNFVLKAGDRIGITAVHGEILKLLKTFGVHKAQNKSVMIVGASKISYYLTKFLIEDGVKVKLVDVDPEKCRAFSNAFPDAITILGDGMNLEVLLEEGLQDVDAFIALTDKDEQNILSSLSVTEQKVQTVIAKVNRPDLALTAEKLGLNCIISPQSTVSNIVTRYARALKNSMGSNVVHLYKLMDGKAEVLEFNVLPDFEFINIPLMEMKFKNNILIAAIVRNRKPIIPTGSDVIMPGDKVIVVASGRQLGDLSDAIEG
ncbi:MAG: Trk system potassium transporter TrkA [Ruminococcaceae bacterium]|nr:Trk system potassium transporter TrkA [Oscillospiraceae bacterium]